MTTPAFLRWCPQCQRATDNAPLPQMGSDGHRLRRLRAGTPDGFARRLYCLACSHIWCSLELPEDYVHELLDNAAVVEQLRRELAMARLLLAKDQQETDATKSTAKSGKSAIKLHRAA